jgi:Flp pilus assembly pilin Flp
MRDVKRNEAEGWRFWGAFLRLMRGNSSGATFIEYLMVAGLLALGAIAGFKQLQLRGTAKVQNQARTIVNLPGTPALGFVGPGAGSRPGLGFGPGPGGTSTSNPNPRRLPIIQQKCFAAGTLVSTASGDRPIEELAIGDLVWSRDTDTGETALQPIVEAAKSAETEVIELDLATGRDRFESILVTPLHPFYVEGRGFVAAAELGSVGDLGGTALTTDSGSPLRALGLATWHSRETVYHLEVATFHTYFVGEGHVLVHNGCAPVVKTYDQWNRDPNKPAGTQSHHLNQNAVYGPPGGGKISRGAGASIPLKGSACVPGTEHNAFHKSLEGFWNKYRGTGKDPPTNAEYSAAVYDALIQVGFAAQDARRIADDAARALTDAGYKPEDDVPLVPKRMTCIEADNE